MRKQARAIVSGRVQGAAYRDNVERVAYEFPVAGTVRNLDDETVEIICEGESRAVAGFLKRIYIRRWPIMVEQIRVSYRKPTGESQKFRAIRPQPTNQDIIDRLDLGMGYMSEMNGNIGSMDTHVQRMDTHVQRMDTHIQRMDTNMGEHFRRLDRKYDKFGKTMNGMSGQLRRSGKDARATRAHMKNIASDIKAIRNAATSRNGRRRPVTD